MTITIFHEADGAITDFIASDQLTPDDITNLTPPGGGHILSDDYPDGETQYVSAGALADRPEIDVEPDWVMTGDGADSVWFEAPDETEVLVTRQGSTVLVAEGITEDEGLVTFTSVVSGRFILLVTPPWPWQVTEIAVDVGGPESDDASETPPGSPATVLSFDLAMPVLQDLEVLDKPKFNRADWDVSKWPFHAYYELTRYGTESDALADANGVLIGPITDSFYKDADNLANGLVWYRVNDVDDLDNRSPKSAPVSVTARGAKDTDIDQTAPATPTALTLTQTAKTTDAGDGRIEIGIKATWTAPASGVPVKRYMIEISDGVDTIYKYTKQSPYRFNGVVGTTYAVKVNAEAFSGVVGPQTAAVNITPTGKVTAPGSPTSVTLVPKAKMMRVKGIAPADKDLAGFNYYFNTVNNAGTAVLLDFSDATKYDDTTERAGGTSCYYWMAAVNRSGVEGTRVPASNNPQLSRGASINDLAVGLPGNYLPNSDLSAALAGWGYEWSDDPSLFLFGLRTDTYAPHPGALQIYQKDGSAGHVYGAGPKNPDGSTMYFSVQAGEWYELSTYYLGHRCEGIRPYIRWERWNSTTGAWELSAHANPGIYPAYQATNPNKKLSEYVRTPFVKLQAPADAGRCTVFWRHAGTRQGFGFTDSYLWLHKMYFGVCGANQTEATPWSPTAPNLIGAGNTNATPLIAPTGLTLAQNYQLVDQGDGTVKTKYKATWNPLAGAVRFELQISQADTAGGTYTVISNILTTATLAEFDVVVGKFYKAVLRAFSFNGTPGAQTSPIGPVQPLAAATTLTTPAAPTVIAIANGYQYSWALPSDKTYRETAVLVDGVELRRTAAGYLIDTTPREIGATPNITIRHYDRSGNSTAVSGITAAPAWRATKAAEIGAMEVKPSKLFRAASTNRIRDYELEEPEVTMHFSYALFSDLVTLIPIAQGDGGAEPGWIKELNPPVDLMGSSFNRIRFNGSGYPLNARIYSETDRLTPVEEGLDYLFEFLAKATSPIDRFTVVVRFFTVTAGVITYLSEETNTTTATKMTPVNGTPYRLWGVAKAPAGAVYASVRVETISYPAQIALFSVAAPKIREMSVAGDTCYAAITAGSGSVTNGNSDFVVIESQAITLALVPRSPRHVKIGFRARNNSGSAADMNFKLQWLNPDTSSWEQIDQTGTIRMSVNGPYSEVFLDDITIHSTYKWVGSKYRILCTPSQGGNDLNSRRLWVEWVYG